MNKSLLFLILLITFASCQSKSSQLANQPAEKIVIIDGVPSNEPNKLMYKVKRINYGVTTYIILPKTYRFECGDTIFYKFNPIE